MVKLEGSLLLKKQIADIVSLAILEFKEQFKNLDLEDVKNDYHYIIYLANFIEKLCNDKSLMSAENKAMLDKNEILLGIIKGIYPQINNDEIKVIEGLIGIILSQKLIKKPNSVVIKCAKKILNFFF